MCELKYIQIYNIQLDNTIKHILWYINILIVYVYQRSVEFFFKGPDSKYFGVLWSIVTFSPPPPPSPPSVPSPACLSLFLLYF